MMVERVEDAENVGRWWGGRNIVSKVDVGDG